ncbi:MAG: NYN domain-containing protein [Syntrophaceae bacterium]|nr:NYN domain-containing protein [Syntrophaceae bacterium]
MPYLVDGNNVIGGFGVLDPDQHKSRKKLIDQLATFVKVTRQKVRVVFDGAQDPEFPEGTKVKSVQIFYAKSGSDADQRIKDIVKKSSSPRDIVVVSSDRDLAAFVCARGAKVIGSRYFRNELRKAQELLRISEKTNQSQKIDVDYWMNYFLDKR